MGRKMIAVIDMQKGFQNEYTEGLDQKQAGFLEQIRDSGALVIGTVYVNHENTACYRFEGWKDCMRGSKETEVLDAVKPYLEYVFEKDRYSFWNEEMRCFVKEHEIEKIYFMGVNTGCCVLHSAFSCYDDVVDCAVIEDLCGSTSGPKEHQAALVVLRSCITQERVITASQAAAEILAAESKEL